MSKIFLFKTKEYDTKKYRDGYSWNYLFYVDGRMLMPSENINAALIDTRIINLAPYKTKKEALKDGLKLMTQFYELTSITEGDINNDISIAGVEGLPYSLCGIHDLNKSEVKPKPVSDEDIEQYCKALIKKHEEDEKEWQRLEETKQAGLEHMKKFYDNNND